ncbi:S-layer homology domain-containing protein [Lawsonibacter hominis]|uniref:S-layer homology domain-containing protein n=1 Tax=Lawsonibacter hominis TaxID=2763053 RepID=UPI00331DA1B8
MPAAKLWVSFYDADGKHASQQMSYVGPTEDGRYEFSLTFQPGSSFYDYNYGGSFYYKNTQSIRVFATDMSNEYHDNELYRGVVMGEPVERILVFGNPAYVILPQFAGGSVLINQTSYTLFGYASPNGSVTVSETDKLPVTAETNGYGYFTAELTGLTERTHTLTVADDSGAVGSKTVYLTVDTTPPTVSDVTFTFLENNAAVLHWTCSDKDVDYFQIYKNDVPLGKAQAGSTSYNVAASADDGNRFTIEAVDLAGNKSQKTVSTADQEPPTAPEELTVTGRTTTTVTLSWTAGTDNIGVDGYNVFVNGEQAEKLTGDGTTYTVTGLRQNTSYTFTVQTRDKAGNTSEDSPSAVTTTASLSIADDLKNSYTVLGDGATLSIPLTVTAVSDVEDYTPVLQQVTLQYQTGGETPGLWQDGDLTVEYSGDRATVTWAAPVDADHLPMQYNVCLGITDSEGAHAMGQTRTVNLVEGRVTFTVQDSNTTGTISGATVSLYQDGVLKTSATTDERGVAKLDVPDGTYSVMVLADGHQPRRIPNLAISEAKKTFTIPMSTEDILQVETTVKEMTDDDMVAAGIDPNAPGNRHVFESTVILDFVEVKYYYNDDGQVVKGDPVPFEGGVLYPAAKDIFLIVPSRVTWLKEMFDVQLLVTNSSAMETVKDCTATLNLPNSLSLADMMEGQQSATVELGDIAPSGAALHHWYVRGDAKGDYTLSGTVTGTRTFGDIAEPIKVGFTTKDPISVLAGDAMKMTITAEWNAVTGEPYRMRFELRNVSGKSLYNVNFEVFGGTFREAYTIDEVLAAYDLKGPFQPDAGAGALKNGFTLSAQEFQPSDVLAGTFTITFADGLDLPNGIEYMLKQVFLFTGAGSTTEIPVEVVLVDSLDDAHTHVYDEGVVTTAATCTEKGVMTYTCTVEDCMDTLTVEIPALGHNMGQWTVTKAATCTETGTAESQCTRCDHTESMTLGVLGHDFSEEWTTDVEPTCTEAGSKSHHCTRCGEKTDVTEIPATGHTSTESDCTKDDVCSVCHEVIRKAGEHVWGEPDVTKAATCTEAGSQTLTCTSCGAKETQEIPALGHDYQAVVTQPTCTEQGYTTHTCSRCDDSYVDDYVDALGHDWGEWEVTKPATETEDGSQTRTCQRAGCGATETETISKWPQQELEWPFNIGETVSHTYGAPDFRAEATNNSTDGGEVTYTSSNTDVATVASNGLVTIQNAGTTTITATAAAVTDKYAKTEISYTLVVNKKSLTITANDHTITYGEAPANGGYTASGFVKGEGDSVLTGTAAYTCAYQQFGKAGEYAIEISGLTAKNYYITFVAGKLIVQKAADYTITLGDLEQSMAGLGPVSVSITPQDSTAWFTVEYLVNGGWTTALPTEAGEYSVRAALTFSDNLVPSDAKIAEGTLVIQEGAFVDTGDANVSVDVDVDGNKAEVTLPDGALDEILANADGDTSIDLGNLTGVKDVTLPGDLLDGLAKGDGSLTISSEDASISMSDKVLDTIADAVTGPEDKVTLHMSEVRPEDMNPAQQAALESLPNAPAIVDLSLVVTHDNGTTTTLSELNGNVEVTIPYTVPDGMEGQTAVACYISADGYITYIRAKYENGAITFTTNHFSNYAVFVSEQPAVIVTGGSGSGLYAVDETVTITADSKSGYRFDHWEIVSGNVTLANANSAETTFTMSAENVELTAVYIPVSTSSGGGGASTSTYAVTVEPVQNGSVSVQPRKAAQGDTVTVTVQPDKGYQLDQLTVTDGSEKAVSVKAADGKYTFVMPASKVTISATFVEETAEPTSPFTDVATSAYYYNAVLWAVDNGVTNGTSATTFSPNADVSRAQMVTFLWRAAGSPKATGTNPFADVKTSDYYYDAVLWAVANGVTVGTSDTTFCPDMAVTRAQAVTFQWRAAGSPVVSGSNFDDVAADAYYVNAVTWAVANGITNGTGGNNFGPDAAVTRAQAVTFLWRELA